MAARNLTTLARVTDPEQLRISDADRHRVAEVLREAAGEGRLDLEELDERLEAAYAAKVYADLVPILADLPGLPPAGRCRRAAAGGAVERLDGTGPPVRLERRDHGRARPARASGRWAPSTRAFAMWAGIDIDLRQAVFTERETVIYANAIWAGIDVDVNAHTNVIVEGVGIMGAFDQARDKVEAQIGPDSPTVRVKGVALMAGVTVKRRKMPGEERRKRLPR